MRQVPLLPTALAAVTLIVLLLFGAIIRQNVAQMRSLREETASVEHTLQVQRVLDGVLLQASEADSTARGYLITAGDTSLSEFARARGSLADGLAQLEELTRDNAAQQQRIGRLRNAIGERLNGLERVLAVRRTASLDVAMAGARSTDTNRWRAEIRDIAGEMEREEARLLEIRRSQAERAYTLAVNGRIGSGVVSGILLVGLAALYGSYASSRHKREAALIESERRAREAVAREQEARAEAEHANRLKDDFLAVLSHELRTPLNAVLGWAQIVQAASPQDPTVTRALASIKRNAEAQQRLVEDLLDVSRIVTGKFPLAQRPLDLRHAVAAAVESIRPVADAKDIRLNVALADHVPVHGDPDRLQQVTTNLLTNAVKFSAPGGSIDVRLSRADGRAELTVSDTGEGIAPELQPHIFDRFRQGDASSTRAHGGLGLGLAIARHIVDAHGGTIAAWSAGKGQGSTFSVQLPLQ